MTNQTEILRTIFHGVKPDGEMFGPSYGVCIYDSHGNGYCDTIEDLETLINMSPADLVACASEAEPCGAEIIEDVLAFGSAILIDEIPYRLVPSQDGFEVCRIEGRKAV